ncbi:MAG: hypothetical protein S4CHLAM81_06210 [Chlamydiales bacterium]|nr:hypothetical protein [Chlamydiales bacterium]MCH9635405.1 hypothetical protein [Chlamydiales bacterium]MCH9703243.1 hypothetical protein [Chlamydiota bacterium]
MAAALEHIRATLGCGAHSTASKIVTEINRRIQESEAVKGICTEKGWLTPTKNLNLTVSFGERPLSMMIAAALESKTHYVAYQVIADGKKKEFRTAIATKLAEEILKTAEASKAAGSESFSYLAGKPVITATVTFTPLQKEAVEEAIIAAADTAGLLKK